MQDWGDIKVEEAEYVPATDEEIAAGKVELFTVTRAPRAPGGVRGVPDAAVKVDARAALARRAAGETVERKGDNRTHAERYQYTDGDLRSAAAAVRGAR